MSVRFEQVSTLPWNISTAYEKGTKVAYDGKCYVSKKDVPVGVNIGMGDYWKKMELKDDVTELAEAVEDLSETIEDLELNDLDDVNITTAVNNEILSFDGTSSKWINKTITHPLPVNYSTTEHIIGTWINDETLYEKTVYVGALTQDESWHNVPHNIANIDKIVSIDTLVLSTTDTIYWNVPIARIGQSYGIMVGVSLTNIQYMNTWMDNSADCYVTIRYTKVTV